MSMVPEEFPAVLSVFMVMGAWRLSRAHVLTRRAATIETLGAATVLCTDKTGTLTENRMTVAEIRTGSDGVRAPEGQAPSPEALQLVQTSVLASTVDPFDPMEKALHEFGKNYQLPLPFATRSLARSYPLRPDLLTVANAWRRQDGSHLIAAKGAPEAIIGLCRLPPERAGEIERNVKEMAQEGMRVLAVAQAVHGGTQLPLSQRDFAFEYVGLVALADPIRASVPQAIRECREAGIRVVMITGDYPETARAIAIRAGLAAEEIITGESLNAMTDEQLRSAVASACVFARIMPEDKLKLVRALKANGEVVAMTGDGVNDAPALKAADIGIAMGGRGTDVAREASSLVLLDDDFSSIVHTVRLGRRIYDNLRKAMGYILAIHVLIAGIALLPLVTGLALVLLPIHVAFLEMVIDPVCSIAFEAEGEEADIMRRPPRSPRSRLLKPTLIQWALLQGLLGLLAIAAVYLGGYRSALPAPDLRSLTYVALIGVNFCLVLASRSFDFRLTQLFGNRNPVLWIVADADLLLLAIAVLWPPAKSLFVFGAFHFHDLLFVITAMAGVLLSLRLIKALVRNRFRQELAE
jgi:Ca2+-transporting ATPase